ncbi:MAG: tRNA (adenosine(37)-N6)-threonylcarbamoyltransferase complex ATPase subunit type 1 TsaE [Parcubacteria group bacterium 21-54-25]|nr:MAG: tRNA (adenosine(37)-N6)-threonylcarbamoyltransferase complex ATPase subunit type 1 TsaE [Parcubacteria group bacterium 21-54-25]HQU07725.1 tRNA (adenosine(37)-N6)-threonylcarbamoyltransferase complex ATPase subunit type 1 TsaE [Candidatus Paceibacterota bacterium]
MEKECRTLEDLYQEAARFVSTLIPHENAATLITLSGALGAGKTAFTKAVARSLGVEERVTSPTFVLEKIYDLPAPRNGTGFARLVHIDAYRLEGATALSPLGFDALMRDPQNLILIEWPEQVVGGLPEPATRISFVARNDESRTVTYA